MQSTNLTEIASLDLSRPAQGCLIWGSPIILYTSQIQATASFVNSVGDLLADREVILLPLVAWTLESIPCDDWFIQKIRSYEASHPKHKIIHMCNTEREVESLRACGCRAEWFNHNIFLDPHSIHPVQSVNKDFDAVYNAQMPAVETTWSRSRNSDSRYAVPFFY